MVLRKNRANRSCLVECGLVESMVGVPKINGYYHRIESVPRMPCVIFSFFRCHNSGIGRYDFPTDVHTSAIGLLFLRFLFPALAISVFLFLLIPSESLSCCFRLRRSKCFHFFVCSYWISVCLLRLGTVPAVWTIATKTVSQWFPTVLIVLGARRFFLLSVVPCRRSDPICRLPVFHLRELFGWIRWCIVHTLCVVVCSLITQRIISRSTAS